MKIIRQCPYYDRATRAEIAGQSIDIRPYQMILWTSLRVRGLLSRRFPVIFDTGHTLNFSIQERQARDWAGVNLADLKRIGHTTLNNRPVDILRADLALHRNVRGHRDELLAEEPYQLELPDGIVVHAEGDPDTPRLPLLGLRALTHNRLVSLIDSDYRELSIIRPWRPWRRPE